MNTKQKEYIEKFVKEGVTIIAAFMLQTHGFPLELFGEEFDKRAMNLGSQLIFVNEFFKKHPSLGKPLHFNDIKDLE